MIDVVHTYFFELLQVAVGNRDVLSGVPSPEEWGEIYEISKKQTLVGIAFKGVERLPEGQLPPRHFIRQWFVKADRIRKMNVKMNVYCAKTCFILQKEGLHSCIIKGQANLRYYGASSQPSHREGDIGGYRTPGDIDVWAWSDSGKVSDVIRFAKNVNRDAAPHYHHVDCNLTADTETEMHYRPSWMSAPWRNRVLQKFCNQHKSDICKYPVLLPDGKKTFFCVPSLDFDAVYQLVHIYRHLFNEGIGLRQVLDYWTVLTSLVGRNEVQEEAYHMICKLGMKRFASAVMWVIAKVFDPLHNDWMLCEPNEKDGRFLLNEIIQAGNFGHYDERYNITREDNAIKWGIMKLKRNMKFLSSYPEEVICEPFFRVFHFTWRVLKLWRF